MNLLELIRFRLRMLLFAFTVKPIAGGSPEGDDKEADKDADTPDPKDDADADKDKDADKPDPKDDADKEDEDDDEELDKPVTKKPDEAEWRRLARKAQRDHARLKEKFDKLQQQDNARTEKEKSEHQKELDKVRDDTKAELTRLHEQERRQDRLESATTLMASRGVKVGEGDKERSIKFNDPDDALVNLERAIKRGDVDGEDVFDKEGKVDKKALQAALAQLLEDKPHLGKETKSRKSESAGDGDQGKGSGSTGKEVEDMTPDDHFKAIFKGSAGSAV
jgi:hypothetical protein